MLGTQPFISMDICKEDGRRTEKRDPCSSPPCKRLRQAPISFETMHCTTKEINVKPNSPLLNQDPSTNTLSLSTHHLQQSGQCNSSENNCKINPPPPVSFIILDSDEPAQNEHKRKSASNLPESPKHKSQNNSKNNSILKFTQPVTPGHPINVNVSKTPSKDSENSPTALSTPLKQVISPTTPMLSDQFTSPSLPPTPNTPKTNTPKQRTPARKLSVEERLKREEEKLKKQKEKEKLEQERLEKKNEKDRIKVEKEKERQDAKQKKEQERLEQVAQKKQQEEERQEKKEKEEKEKMEKLEKKEEERKKREEEKKKKENEKNSKNEEKLKKEEEQIMKKQKVQNHFANFFIKKELSVSPKQKEQVKNETKFQPFEIKPGMKLANTKCRQPLSDEAKDSVNKILSEQVTTSLSQVKEEMQKLKTELAHERKIQEESTKKSSKIDDDIMLIEHDVSDGTVTIDNEKQYTCIKGKLLQFHDNYRPAYFGSWRKQSSSVGPRAPFRKDMNLINYEVDSDEEWEEEEPGESLSNSEGEDEDNEGNNTEVNDGENDGFFVPHGYLSDDEGVENVEDNETQDIDTTDSAKLPQHNVEDRMERQLAKQKVWETEMKRQFKPMKPVAIGCIWSGEIPSILKQLEGCSLVESQSIDPSMPSKNYNHVPSSSPVSNMHCTTAMTVPEEAMPTLITLVHGNTIGLHKLIQMFRRKWTLQTKKDETVLESNWEDHCQISKRQLERKITTIAKKERRAAMPKARWYVHDSVLAQYKMENISLPRNGYISLAIEQTSLLSKVSPSELSTKQFTQNHPSSMHNEINLHVKSVELIEENLMHTSPV